MRIFKHTVSRKKINRLIAVSQFKFSTHEEITSEFSEIVDDFLKDM